MKKIVWIIPLCLIALYIVTMVGMRSYERNITVLYDEYSEFIVEFMKAETKAEKRISLGEFASDIKLTASEKGVIFASSKLQIFFDAVTLGKPHCVVSQSGNCKVYTGDILRAAKVRQVIIQGLSKKDVE